MPASPNEENFGSVSGWIGDLKDGDRDSVEKIWERYFFRLQAFARHRLSDNHDRLVDEEDIAIHSFTQFVEGAENGKFRQLNNRADLWQILAMITSRRISNAQRRRRMKAVVFDMIGAEDIEACLASPDSQVLEDLNAECKDLLNRLPERSKKIAIARLKGYTNQEIADELGVAIATVERDLKLIRESWTSLLEEL